MRSGTPWRAMPPLPSGTSSSKVGLAGIVVLVLHLVRAALDAVGEELAAFDDGSEPNRSSEEENQKFM